MLQTVAWYYFCIRETLEQKLGSSWAVNCIWNIGGGSNYNCTFSTLKPLPILCVAIYVKGLNVGIEVWLPLDSHIETYYAPIFYVY